MKAHDAIYDAVSGFLGNTRAGKVTNEEIETVGGRIGGCSGAAFKEVSRRLLSGAVPVDEGACAGKVMGMIAYLRKNANPNSLASAQISPAGLWKSQGFSAKDHQGMAGVAMAFYDHLYGVLSNACAPADVTRQSDC